MNMFELNYTRKEGKICGKGEGWRREFDALCCSNDKYLRRQIKPPIIVININKRKILRHESKRPKYEERQAVSSRWNGR